jgi:hypothetical protein
LNTRRSTCTGNELERGIIVGENLLIAAVAPDTFARQVELQWMRFFFLVIAAVVVLVLSRATANEQTTFSKTQPEVTAAHLALVALARLNENKCRVRQTRVVLLMTRQDSH